METTTIGSGLQPMRAGPATHKLPFTFLILFYFILF